MAYYAKKITHHDHVVSSIKGRRGIVVIQQMGLEVAKPIEVILNPFPHISKDVTKTSFGGWVQVNGLKSSKQYYKVENYILKTPFQCGLLPKTLNYQNL